MEAGLSDKLHHYTSIEVLALILKNKTIRFNRLDRVDDLEESDIVSNGINLSKYLFVSCWTESKEENIPLWKLYANGHDGVKISFPKDFFEEYKITTEDGILHRINVVGDALFCMLPANQLFSQTHVFIPPPMKDGIFYRSIEYVDDVKTKTNKVAEVNDASVNVAFGEVGKYKHKRWEFQNETRFVLTAIPKNENIDMSHPLFSNHMVDVIKSNRDLPFDEYYLKIKDSAFDDMEVTLCPSASEPQRLIVDALLKMYAPNAVLSDSNLKGKVSLK